MPLFLCIRQSRPKEERTDVHGRSVGVFPKANQDDTLSVQSAELVRCDYGKGGFYLSILEANSIRKKNIFKIY